MSALLTWAGTARHIQVSGCTAAGSATTLGLDLPSSFSLGAGDMLGLTSSPGIVRVWSVSELGPWDEKLTDSSVRVSPLRRREPTSSKGVPNRDKFA